MAFSNIILVDLISSVVDSMRETNIITASNEVSTGVYEITSANTLLNNEVIAIDGVNYIVDSVSDADFVINAVTGLDFSGQTWKALAPYYEHGHPVEINNTLKEKRNGIYTYQKYPLIALLEDVNETHDSNETALYATAKATILLVNYTKKNIKSAERYDLNFRNVLIPMYESFKEAIINSNYFDAKEMPNPFTHDKINKPYYGTDSAKGTIANIYDDPLDAIVISNAQLKIINGIIEC